MIPTLDSDAYLERLLSAPRPGSENILAFYDHRLEVLGRDPKFLLMPLDDHLAHRGDGVFETLKFVDGRLYQLDPHLERMRLSSGAIFLDPPCGWDTVRELVLEVVKAAGHPLGLVRILLGRGPGGFGIDPAECPVSSLYIVAYRFHPRPEAHYEQGVSACRTSIPAKQPFMARIKSTDYLPNMLMKREALEKGCVFPVCFDDRGYLAEGSTENICIVDKSGTLVVPEFTNALAGTSIIRVLELIKGEMDPVFRSVNESEIFEARELMAVGTTIDALGIVRYCDTQIGDGRPGPVVKRMRELIHQDIKENGIEI